MSERQRRINPLAYLEAVAYSMLACHHVYFKMVSDNPGSVTAARRSLHADMGLVRYSPPSRGRLQRLALSLRQHIRATCTRWGLEAHDIASKADSLVETGDYTWELRLISMQRKQLYFCVTPMLSGGHQE